MIKKIWNNKLLMSFICSSLLGIIIIVPFIIIGKGRFMLWADYNIQQVPFGEIMNHSLKEGAFLWTWYNDLGSNFIGTFSFYNLFSPFNLISYLFPARWYAYISGILLIFKFGISGMTSYLFLKRYVKNGNYAIIGSLLYTFSGFQLNNIIFHFYDSVVLFPLLLYTLDNLVYDNKKFLFSLTVFLLALTNWFCLIGQGVFVIIYILIKIICKGYEFNFKKIFRIIFEGFLGILMASFVLIPSLLFTISNPRIESGWNLIGMLKYDSLTRYFEIFRSIFFPSEIMHVRAFLTESNFDSVEFYLPFVGSVLAISYFFNKPKKWCSILMLISIIFMFVPVLNSSFFGFKNNYYARWFYMPTLIMSLLSIKCLEENIKIKSGVVVSFMAFILFLCFLIFSCLYHKSYIFDKQYIFLIIVFFLLNLISLVLMFKNKSIYIRNILIFIGCVIYISFWGIYTIYKYRDDGFKFDYNYSNYLDSYNYIDLDDFARTNSSFQCQYNYGYINRLPNIKIFNSNINGTNFEFYHSFDYLRGVTTIIPIEDMDLNNFLSVKYVIACYDNDLEKYGYEKISDTSIYKVYKNKRFIEMGLIFDKYISNDDFINLSTDDKKNTLLKQVVLSEEQIEKYSHLFNKNTKIISNQFQYINNGFNSNIELSNDSLILYTVPYDRGWRATVNGKGTIVENVDNGLIGVVGLKGNNQIKFRYMPPGLVVGTIISIISLIVGIVDILRCLKVLRLTQEIN